MMLEYSFCLVGWVPAHRVNIEIDTVNVEINTVFCKAHGFGGREPTLFLLVENE
jgi:hypothetical protein